MLYEKKMLILSGEGKGVVLIEKSAKGLRFSLSTFDMPICGELKAGIITPKAVFVRDLPQRGDPSSVFIVDADSADGLHFAVFDTKLRLYGTNTKPMWEANVMDLLRKNDRKSIQDDGPRLVALPPIAKPPEVLPLPNGTGIPQSRLEIYGDDQIADNDFYTPIDMSARMPVVEKFLDAPRALDGPSVLDGLAPTLQRPSTAETTAIVDDSEVEDMQDTHSQDRVDAEISDRTEIKAETATPEYSPNTEGVYAMPTEQTNSVSSSPVVGADAQTECEDDVMPAAAAVADARISDKPRPCELESHWLKTRCTRTLKSEISATVKPVAAAATIKPVREISFIERAYNDVEQLFANAEKDEKLGALLPELQWAKVPVDGHVISVGRSGAEFLCYAVTGTYQKTSPLGDQAQWLPENKSIPTGKGYWLIFQSLKDGKIIDSE